MTEFERKRLEHLIKAAEKNEWVQLGKADVNMFQLYKDLKETWLEVQKKKEFIQQLQKDLGECQIPIDKD